MPGFVFFACTYNSVINERGGGMLFILTGDVQIGKTRWLEGVCEELAAAGANVAGVIAPGQWVARPEGQAGGKHGLDGAGRFEKLGIDNVLLPQGRRIVFARRRDLAQAGDEFAGGAQAKAAQLGWAISDDAIGQVNAHFEQLAAGSQPAGGLLVVDELGRLELMRNCGLTAAMDLLDQGPTREFPNALVVVRETLLDLAKERFGPIWGSIKAIAPDDEARAELLAACGVR